MGLGTRKKEVGGRMPGRIAADEGDGRKSCNEIIFVNKMIPDFSSSEKLGN